MFCAEPSPKRRAEKRRGRGTLRRRFPDVRNPSIGNIGFLLLFVYSHYKSACFFLSSASLVSGSYCQVRDYIRARERGREWTRACGGTCCEHFEDPIRIRRDLPEALEVLKLIMSCGYTRRRFRYSYTRELQHRAATIVQHQTDNSYREISRR